MIDEPDLDLAPDDQRPGDVLETIPSPARYGALMVFVIGAIGLALLTLRLVNHAYG